MNRLVVQLVIVAAVVALGATACATSGGMDSTQIVERVGAAYAGQFNDQVPRLLRQHNYSIYRDTQTSDALYFETEWRMRDLLPGEDAMGYTRAQTRVLVFGRPVRGGPLTAAGDLFNIEIRAENRGEREGSWVVMPVSEGIRDYLRPLISDFQLEFRTGVREF